MKDFEAYYQANSAMYCTVIIVLHRNSCAWLQGDTLHRERLVSLDELRNSSQTVFVQNSTENTSKNK